MPRAISGADTVRVEGLDDFRRELRKLDEAGLIEELKDANKSVADFVVLRARLKAIGVSPGAARVAQSLTARRGQRAAEVSFGGPKYPDAAGHEFGAYRDKLRLVKASGRNYIVHDESKLAKTRKRVEAQRNINTGAQTRIVKEVRGWRQFKEWRGNKAGAGYFLFPTIRSHADEIVEMYGDAIDKISAKAFPD